MWRRLQYPSLPYLRFSGFARCCSGSHPIPQIERHLDRQRFSRQFTHNASGMRPRVYCRDARWYLRHRRVLYEGRARTLAEFSFSPSLWGAKKASHVSHMSRCNYITTLRSRLQICQFRHIGEKRHLAHVWQDEQGSEILESDCKGRNGTHYSRTHQVSQARPCYE
jgi:hypothetical protein